MLRISHQKVLQHVLIAIGTVAIASVFFNAGINSSFQSAYAARPMWAVSGMADGALICGNGQSTVGKGGGYNWLNDDLRFHVTKAPDGTLSGAWSITSIYAAPDPFTLPQMKTSTIEGTFTGGNLNKAHFNLVGTVTSDGTCGDPVLSAITIKGDCGGSTTQPVAVEYKSSNGQTGFFNGSVDCSRLKP